MSPRQPVRADQDGSGDVAAEEPELVDLDLHCVPDREHCVRQDDPHLDAVHLDDTGA